MAEMSDYLRDEILDHILGKGTRDFNSPTTLAIALSTTTLNSSDTGATIGEPTGTWGNYSRQAVTFDPASGAQAVNGPGNIDFLNDGGSQTTIVAVAIVDNITNGAGNMLYFDNAISDTPVADGATLRFTQGSLVVKQDIP